MKTVFQNSWQATKVRCVLWFSILVCAAALYGSWLIFRTYGLSAADGGALRPFWERFAVGFFVAALGLAFAGGMMLFASLYATRLVRNGNTLSIDTLTPTGIGTRRHDVDISRVGESAYYHGRMNRPSLETRGILQRIDAPWISMRVARRRYPFIFDLQAETIEIGALSALSEGAVAAWKEDRG